MSQLMTVETFHLFLCHNPCSVSSINGQSFLRGFVCDKLFLLSDISNVNFATLNVHFIRSSLGIFSCRVPPLVVVVREIDLAEMDFKVAILVLCSVHERQEKSFISKNGVKRLSINGRDTDGLTKKVEYLSIVIVLVYIVCKRVCGNCCKSKMEQRKAGIKTAQRRQCEESVKRDVSSKAMLALECTGLDWS
ncbi:hypothetical protein Tco_1369847 [Tanacetum coccineum]